MSQSTPMPSEAAQSGPRPSKSEVAREMLGKMTFGEKMLLRFSKHPHDVERVPDYVKPSDEWTVETALTNYEEAFPNFREMISGKRILDYGCGDGFQSVAMAKAGAASVMGVDLALPRLGFGRDLAKEHGLDNVTFGDKADGEFDFVTTLNAVEHFVKPEENLREMMASLAPGGKILATFGPPWRAPFGAHMTFFSSLPWMNILFSERTIYRVRSLYRSDGRMTHSPGMNKMTIKAFERLVKQCDLETEMRTYRVVKDLPLVGKLPVIRELLINQIDAILVPKG